MNTTITIHSNFQLRSTVLLIPIIGADIYGITRLADCIGILQITIPVYESKAVLYFYLSKFCFSWRTFHTVTFLFLLLYVI